MRPSNLFRGLSVLFDAVAWSIALDLMHKVMLPAIGAAPVGYAHRKVELAPFVCWGLLGDQSQAAIRIVLRFTSLCADHFVSVDDL